MRLKPVGAKPTLERVRELISYDATSGVLKWLVPRRAAAPDGSVKVYSSGYVLAWIDGSAYSGQHLAWLLHYGAWPEHLVDHENRVRSDNRIKNLRAATPQQNARNRAIRKPRTGRMKGVYKRKYGWIAVITLAHGRGKYLGQFSSEAEAAKVYNTAALRHHGEFAVLNEV